MRPAILPSFLALLLLVASAAPAVAGTPGKRTKERTTHRTPVTQTVAKNRRDDATEGGKLRRIERGLALMAQALALFDADEQDVDWTRDEIAPDGLSRAPVRRDAGKFGASGPAKPTGVASL